MPLDRAGRFEKHRLLWGLLYQSSEQMEHNPILVWSCGLIFSLFKWSFSGTAVSCLPCLKPQGRGRMLQCLERLPRTWKTMIQFPASSQTSHDMSVRSFKSVSPSIYIPNYSDTKLRRCLSACLKIWRQRTGNTCSEESDEAFSFFQSTAPHGAGQKP